MTDIPTPGPNHALPPLNPLRARSTIAAVLSFLALLSPLVGGGIGEVITDLVGSEDAIQQGAETGVAAVNALLGIVGLVWYWLERRAPNFRLSFSER